MFLLKARAGLVAVKKKTKTGAIITFWIKPETIKKQKVEGLDNTKASPIEVIKLFLDSALGSFKLGSDEGIGAMLLNSALKKHINKHIHSFYGKTVYNSSDSLSSVAKLLNKEVAFYMRKVTISKEEESGAKKFLDITRKKFNKLIGG